MTAHPTPGSSFDEEKSVEQRGFALYVGVSATKARARGLELRDIVDAMRREVSASIPLAETRALAVIAGADEGDSDLAVVMRAIAGVEPTTETSAEPTAPDDTADRGADDAIAAVVIDLARHRVLVDGRDIHLTYREFSILEALVLGRGGILSREQLRSALGGGQASDINDRSIDVLIRRVRLKLGDHAAAIQTAHRAGYWFKAGASLAVG